MTNLYPSHAEALTALRNLAVSFPATWLAESEYEPEHRSLRVGDHIIQVRSYIWEAGSYQTGYQLVLDHRIPVSDRAPPLDDLISLLKEHLNKRNYSIN